MIDGDMQFFLYILSNSGCGLWGYNIDDADKTLILENKEF